MALDWSGQPRKIYQTKAKYTLLFNRTCISIITQNPILARKAGFLMLHHDHMLQVIKNLVKIFLLNGDLS